jgi:hypothetical protein
MLDGIDYKSPATGGERWRRDDARRPLDSFPARSRITRVHVDSRCATRHGLPILPLNVAFVAPVVRHAHSAARISRNFLERQYWATRQTRGAPGL